MKKLYNFKSIHVFPPMPRYLGYVITLFGILGLFTIGLRALLFCIIGLGLSFSIEGVLIDKVGNRFKEYSQFYWLKFGKWQSLTNYPYLTVLEITEKQTMYSRANVAHANTNIVYEITLLNDTHYSRILLKQVKQKEQAHMEAEQLAHDLQLEKVVYSPGNY